jgi:hypothetical protein
MTLTHLHLLTPCKGQLQQDRQRSCYGTYQGHFAGRPVECTPLSASQLRAPILHRILLTNSIAILGGCQGLIDQPVQSPQANRGDLLITSFQFIQKGLDLSCGLRGSAASWLSNGTPNPFGRTRAGAFRDLSIKMYSRGYEVDMRLDMLR